MGCVGGVGAGGGATDVGAGGMWFEAGAARGVVGVSVEGMGGKVAVDGVGAEKDSTVDPWANAGREPDGVTGGAGATADGGAATASGSTRDDSSKSPWSTTRVGACRSGFGAAASARLALRASSRWARNPRDFGGSPGWGGRSYTSNSFVESVRTGSTPAWAWPGPRSMRSSVFSSSAIPVPDGSNGNLPFKVLR